MWLVQNKLHHLFALIVLITLMNKQVNYWFHEIFIHFAPPGSMYILWWKLNVQLSSKSVIYSGAKFIKSFTVCKYFNIGRKNFQSVILFVAKKLKNLLKLYKESPWIFHISPTCDFSNVDLLFQEFVLQTGTGINVETAWFFRVNVNFSNNFETIISRQLS